MEQPEPVRDAACAMSAIVGAISVLLVVVAAVMAYHVGRRVGECKGREEHGKTSDLENAKPAAMCQVGEPSERRSTQGASHEV